MQYELGYGTLVSIYVTPQWMDKNIIHTNAQPRLVYVFIVQTSFKKDHAIV